MRFHFVGFRSLHLSEHRVALFRPLTALVVVDQAYCVSIEYIAASAIGFGKERTLHIYRHFS